MFASCFTKDNAHPHWTTFTKCWVGLDNGLFFWECPHTPTHTWRLCSIKVLEWSISTSYLLCVFVFFGGNKWKNPLQRETPLWAMTPGQWVEKSRGHSEPNIISSAYPPPSPRSPKWPVHPFLNAKLWPSAEKPYIINSPLDVEKSTSSVIDHIYYVPAYQGSVSYDRPKAKSFLFSNCLQNLRHFTTQQWPSLVFVFLHYFDKQIQQVHHHPLTHSLTHSQSVSSYKLVH